MHKHRDLNLLGARIFQALEMLPYLVWIFYQGSEYYRRRGLQV